MLSSTRFLQGPPSPLVVTLPCPPASPFDLYTRIASAQRPSFLFESGNGRATTGRYSFFASDPYQTLSGKADQYLQQPAQGHEKSGQAPFQHLARLVGSSHIMRPLDVPPFFGGAVGYFSYDLVRQFERLPSAALDDLATPDLEFAFFDLVAALDHERDCLMLMFCPPLERFQGEPREKLFREGRDRLAALEARLSSPACTETDTDTRGGLAFSPEQQRSSYIDRVHRCQDYIAAGDIYQANLSHRFTVTGDAFPPQSGLQPDLRAYSRVRTLNPSPFSGLLRFDHTSLISSSPERLVRLNGRRADTRPIAGTRPRGENVAADLRLEDELRSNEKECAEHIMLVGRERNDLGRVCDFGSVRVDELMTLERYSLAEMKAIREAPVTDQEIAEAKSFLMGSFPLRLDSTAKLAKVLAQVEFFGLGFDYFVQYPKWIERVTKEDVQRVAKQYLNPQHYALVVVGNIAKAKIRH
ncbi:MAG: hypothetical protein HP491_00405 [Nitrospira sp.]|nr:hypothetical protein [Nitrospira sp.]